MDRRAPTTGFVTASQAVVTYEWSDFRHDPRKVLARYFDAFLYFANWGTRRLMFRFPAGLLDEDAVAPYLMEEMIELSTEGNPHILEIAFEEGATLVRLGSVLFGGSSQDHEGLEE